MPPSIKLLFAFALVLLCTSTAVARDKNLRVRKEYNTTTKTTLDTFVYDPIVQSHYKDHYLQLLAQAYASSPSKSPPHATIATKLATISSSKSNTNGDTCNYSCHTGNGSAENCFNYYWDAPAPFDTLPPFCDLMNCGCTPPLEGSYNLDYRCERGGGYCNTPYYMCRTATEAAQDFATDFEHFWQLLTHVGKEEIGPVAAAIDNHRRVVDNFADQRISDSFGALMAAQMSTSLGEDLANAIDTAINSVIISTVANTLNQQLPNVVTNFFQSDIWLGNTTFSGWKTRLLAPIDETDPQSYASALYSNIITPATVNSQALTMFCPYKDHSSPYAAEPKKN